MRLAKFGRLSTMIALSATAPASAADFVCSKTVVETRCAKDDCITKSGPYLAPMELGPDGDKLEVCAFETCWEGSIQMRQTQNGLDFLYAQVRVTTGDVPDASPLAVIYDARERVAIAYWDSSTYVMQCDN